MRKVLVGLWSRDTNGKRAHASYSETFATLLTAVSRTYVKALFRGVSGSGGQLRTIFVAPEFLFTFPGARDKVKTYDPTQPQTKPPGSLAGSAAIDKDTRNKILADLQVIAYDNMLLIPGTIVFKEELTRDTMKKAIGNLERAIAPVTKEFTKGGAVRIDYSRATKPNPYGSFELNDPDITEKYLGVPEKPTSGTADAGKALYEAQIKELKWRYNLVELNPQERYQLDKQPELLDRTFLIKNRTYVFFNRKRIFSFGKKCNMGDFFDDAERGIFVPGKKGAITSEIDNLKVGFEICLDHSKGVLRDLMGSKKDLDLQIICSAEVPNTALNFVVKEGGFTLHASSKKEHTAVYQCKLKGVRREFVKIDPVVEDEVGGDSLRFYELDLDQIKK